MKRVRASLLSVVVLVALPLGACAQQTTSAPAAGSPRSIEAGAQDFLRRNPAPSEIQSEWLDWVNRYGGEVWARPALSRAQRSVITISVLSVLREPEPLRVHIEAGLANGLSRAQIGEVIMHTAVYAGVPQALRSMRIAREVFDRLDAASAAPSNPR